MNRQHTIFTKMLLEKAKQDLHRDGLLRRCIEEELGIDFLFPRRDVLQFIQVMKHIGEDIPHRGRTNPIKIKQDFALHFFGFFP